MYIWLNYGIDREKYWILLKMISKEFKKWFILEIIKKFHYTETDLAENTTFRNKKMIKK